MRDLFRTLERMLAARQSAVLVTVVDSSGSVPRGAGARMLVGTQGRVAGTVGGGAVEYRCEQTARELLAAGVSRTECFPLHKHDVQDLGMVCGGDASVHFCYIPAGDRSVLALTREVEDLFCRRETAWLISEITQGGAEGLSVFSPSRGTVGAPVPPEILRELGSRPRQLRISDRVYFCEELILPGRVFIFGGGHVAQKLVPALAAVDFRCVVLEDRADFCTPELFPDAEEVRFISNDDPAAYAGITADDYICVMTRGHKDDMVVQYHALKTPARYVGVMGSRAKTKYVFARLREMGCTDEDLARITTPIGLPIRAETPAEIAVSVTAQLILCRAQAADMGKETGL